MNMKSFIKLGIAGISIIFGVASVGFAGDAYTPLLREFMAIQAQRVRVKAAFDQGHSASVGETAASAAITPEMRMQAFQRGTLTAIKFHLGNLQWDGYGHSQYWLQTQQSLSKVGWTCHLVLEKLILKNPGSCLPSQIQSALARFDLELKTVSQSYDGASGSSNDWEDWSGATGRGLKYLSGILEEILKAYPPVVRPDSDPALAMEYIRGTLEVARNVAVSENLDGKGADEYWQRLAEMMVMTGARTARILMDMRKEMGTRVSPELGQSIDEIVSIVKAISKDVQDGSYGAHAALALSEQTAKQMQYISELIKLSLDKTGN
ncbi:MAG TPA: hypothetical protein PLM07_13130 [Candidatus Rifleibacterium sp.]|nr:hypothetical protein [Candidatus Rifleibacterium sp.]HPT46828.1 hypothetical protein [Candidatus Rifleibacterium sp.]